jgi:hypothetical protein
MPPGRSFGGHAPRERHGLKPEAEKSPVSRGHKKGPAAGLLVFRPLDGGHFPASGFNPWPLGVCVYCGAAPAMIRTPWSGRRYFWVAALTWAGVTAL